MAGTSGPQAPQTQPAQTQPAHTQPAHTRATREQLPEELAAACSQVRLAGPDDTVGGRPARYVARPGSEAEAAAVLRAAAGSELAVVARGTGTRLDWGLPPRRCELIVDTSALDAVLEHEAGDLVAQVQAGARLEHVAATLARAGQRLALDPPGAASGGTIGGLLATAVAGPLRLRYGTPRDLLIGITVVRPDGQLTKAGGKVVKNVAGYDLGKLYTGSYGTLGLIVAATFRLHPLPAAAAWVTLDCGGDDPAQAAAGALATALDSPLAPVAAEIDRLGRAAPLRAGILLEGDPDGVRERATGLRDLLGAPATVSEEAPDWWGRGAAADRDGTLVRIGFWTGRLPEVLAAVDAAATAAGVDPPVGGSAAAGVLHVAVPAAADPAAAASFVTGLRAALAGPAASDGDAPPATGSVVVLHAPPEVRAAVDVWGPVPSGGLMRAVKDQFDPGHRMAPGRFAGGI
jgi:glycolate oxidase FAD binding subunit